LARLDLALAVLLLVAGYVASDWRRPRALAVNLTAFGVAALLVPIYAAANYLYFGAPLPVSALAKRLITKPGFDLSYLRRVALGTPYGRSMALLLPLGVLALCWLIQSDNRARVRERFIGAVPLIFAAVFFGLNALGGWILFGWYAYPLATAAIV